MLNFVEVVLFETGQRVSIPIWEIQSINDCKGEASGNTSLYTKYWGRLWLKDMYEDVVRWVNDNQADELRVRVINPVRCVDYTSADEPD